MSSYEERVWIPKVSVYQKHQKMTVFCTYLIFSTALNPHKINAFGGYPNPTL
jgi:hypothetical protein